MEEITLEWLQEIWRNRTEEKWLDVNFDIVDDSVVFSQRQALTYTDGTTKVVLEDTSHFFLPVGGVVMIPETTVRVISGKTERGRVFMSPLVDLWHKIKAPGDD